MLPALRTLGGTEIATILECVNALRVYIYMVYSIRGLIQIQIVMPDLIRI